MLNEKKSEKNETIEREREKKIKSTYFSFICEDWKKKK